MFGRVSDAEMTKLKARFGTLRDALVFARNAPDGAAACKELKKVFGSDFPCPDTDGKVRETARRTAAPAIVPSSSSAA